MGHVQKELELVKFTLTSNMSLELIKFNKLKKELIELKNEYKLNKDDKEMQLKIKSLQEELFKTRDKFIKEFRLNNKKEIDRYLKIKDQI